MMVVNLNFRHINVYFLLLLFFLLFFFLLLLFLLLFFLLLLFFFFFLHEAPFWRALALLLLRTVEGLLVRMRSHTTRLNRFKLLCSITGLLGCRCLLTSRGLLMIE